MKVHILYLIIVSSIGLSSCSAQFGDLLNKAKKELKLEELSTADVAAGLKEALSKGTSKGADQLSIKDGFYRSIYKIVLPDEAKAVCDKLKFIPGFDRIEETVLEKINRAAEDAAIKAKPIFLSAIRQMTFQDAWNILTGAENAATLYLIKTTREALYDEFDPVITESLNKFGALDYWASAVNKYNKIPLVKPTNPDLADHVNNKALDGLFKMIENEEKEIRNNIASRTTDLLRRVFSRQDKK
ncbi:MAG: DUF4197 domain-containing protein [Bacteroidota bacterium]|nr:DUF4197 domain-containing protein [Bacteroidota bacterium]